MTAVEKRIGTVHTLARQLKICSFDIRNLNIAGKSQFFVEKSVNQQSRVP
jgi:hypothetical protein